MARCQLHLLRCFKDSFALPKLDSASFYRCCSSVLEREKGCKDSALSETLTAYQSK